MLFHFETKAMKGDCGQKIQETVGKCQSQFYQFSLGPKIPGTHFRQGRLERS